MLKKNRQHGTWRANSSVPPSWSLYFPLVFPKQSTGVASPTRGVLMIPPASSAQSSREEFVDVGAAVASIVFDVVGAAIRVFEGKPTADTVWYLLSSMWLVLLFGFSKENRLRTQFGICFVEGPQ
jgi:hypothetical protein